ncbi:acyl-CoA dehydrogenase family protein [Sphingomonas montanisoli]|uniref:Acyl-CoA dehydrogenase n=1 Tax=Sphingomonas montanisoli TaxID=2606412 RepID=A0A5D9C1T5_9SPHN|nr:acyl-CoA dehydrogenase family protein [Sphingomonas montanisoli]TZG25177.1 acyl-CoA dehydrogenase [Sphingomonas montanisoli]
MDFRYTPEDEAFRQEVRAGLRAILPDDIRERQRLTTTMNSDTHDQRVWFSLLDDKGWSVPAWPTEYGGPGWSAIQKYIFEDEMYLASAPEFQWTGTHMVGPVIYHFGDDAQKERFLPAIRRGDHIWCQGFSEPGSGSDLASLRTHAKLEGNKYVVNGQKIWTSTAYEADWGFFLVKTDLTVKPQAGISFLLIDMKSPGITVRRIPQINDEEHLCEVFLDNVEVPAENLVGTPGKGWTSAKFLLEHERTSSAFIFWNKRELRRARMIADDIVHDGRPLSQSPAFAGRLARLEADLAALEWSVLRVLANESHGFDASVASSILKLRGSEMQQATTEIQVDLLATRGLRAYVPGRDQPAPSLPDWPEYVPGRTAIATIMRAATLYGGTKQVQKNILAKLAFGL